MGEPTIGGGLNPGLAAAQARTKFDQLDQAEAAPGGEGPDERGVVGKASITGDAALLDKAAAAGAADPAARLGKLYDKYGGEDGAPDLSADEFEGAFLELEVDGRTPRTQTVAAGDTLSAIAKAWTGDAAKWGELYAANKDVIGKDPNLIRPGQELKIPEAWRQARIDAEVARAREEAAAGRPAPPVPEPIVRPAPGEGPNAPAPHAPGMPELTQKVDLLLQQPPSEERDTLIRKELDGGLTTLAGRREPGRMTEDLEALAARYDQLGARGKADMAEKASAVRALKSGDVGTSVRTQLLYGLADSQNTRKDLNNAAEAAGSEAEMKAIAQVARYAAARGVENPDDFKPANVFGSALGKLQDKTDTPEALVKLGAIAAGMRAMGDEAGAELVKQVYGMTPAAGKAVLQALEDNTKTDEDVKSAREAARTDKDHKAIDALIAVLQARDPKWTPPAKPSGGW